MVVGQNNCLVMKSDNRTATLLSIRCPAFWQLFNSSRTNFVYSKIVNNFAVFCECRNNYLQIIPDLVKHGADVNVVDERDNCTALHFVMTHSGIACLREQH